MARNGPDRRNAGGGIATREVRRAWIWRPIPGRQTERLIWQCAPSAPLVYASANSPNGRRNCRNFHPERIPPDNPRDLYFARVLAYAPDPLLMGTLSDPDEAAEPPLPVDPEPIRTIVPGQSDDRAGFTAMQLLVPSESPVHFMVPLPSGLPEDAPELLGFFTYEFRVGHNEGWSTAQGRFGAALRVTGVQHPAPPLTCTLVRTKAGIVASAAYSNPVQDGRSVRPFPPVTDIFVMIYAQVYQSDNQDFRNVLLSHKRARFQRKQFDDRQSTPDALFADASWSASEIRLMLDGLTLGKDTPLICLAVETLPGGSKIADPLGANLGQERLLRTSPLVPVPPMC